MSLNCKTQYLGPTQLSRLRAYVFGQESVIRRFISRLRGIYYLMCTAMIEVRETVSKPSAPAPRNGSLQEIVSSMGRETKGWRHLFMAILIPLRLHTSVLYSASIWAYYVFMRSHWPQERARRTHLLLRNSRLHPGYPERVWLLTV